MRRLFTLFLLLLIISNLRVAAQDDKAYKTVCIAFYNLENLFDTKDDPDVEDEEFTSEGKNHWTDDIYNKKLENIAEAISQIGTDLTSDGPAIIGVSEIENRGVLEELIKEEQIKARNYNIVHYDSPDKRGVDVGFLYQPKYFTVTNSKKYTLKIQGDTAFYTRDQLLVSGIFDGDTLHIIVNHWPSRRGGEKKSRPLRNAAADLCRSISDSILRIDINAKIIIMGDLNDDPIDQSVKKHIKTADDPQNLKQGEFFNPMEKLFKSGIGSLAYRDTWNLFDQIILSPALTGNHKGSYKFHSVKVFNKKFLTQTTGQYKGYPLRTFSSGTQTIGYSDHFPVYIFLAKENVGNR
ncbi:MAG: endonuclease/exonuclease/phosphatase family protein [Bacteroidia bacterium]|nr:endonuclease/exonuclease/phosphatase family protein [Bacteroidia bacterium]